MNTNEKSRDTMKAYLEELVDKGEINKYAFNKKHQKKEVRHIVTGLWSLVYTEPVTIEQFKTDIDNKLIEQVLDSKKEEGLLSSYLISKIDGYTHITIQNNGYGCGWAVKNDEDNYKQEQHMKIEKFTKQLNSKVGNMKLIQSYNLNRKKV